MFKIDNHVGVATSGLMADARQLVARSRVEARLIESLMEQLFLLMF